MLPGVLATAEGGLSMPQTFALHPRLTADCEVLGRLTLCRVLLMNDTQYPWCILVPERVGVSEIHQLEPEDRLSLIEESAWLGERLLAHFGGDKLNVAALGNRVSQLHLHHVVRYRDDAAWPGPVWGRLPARPYEPAALTARVLELTDLLRPLLQPLGAG